MRPLPLALAAVLSVSPNLAQAVPKPASAVPPSRARLLTAPAKVTSVEGITEYRLGNGLRVLLFPDPSTPSMTVNVTYLVGSRNENYGETGMAHLLEHLLFKGTPGHPQPVRTLNALGARFNGTTNFDRTNYFVSFPASEDNLRTALELEADRMVNSFIARKDLDTEMTVVRNEFERGENSPFGVTQKRLFAVAFDWHNYGKATIGARSDIENVDIPRLQAFYRMYYQPDNAVLLVAGRIDEAKTLALVNQLFGSIPAPRRALPMTYTLDPTQDGERSVTLRRVGGTPLLEVGYKIPSGPDPDSAALGLATTILADTPGGRLHKALVDNKLATEVFGFARTTREPGLLVLGASLPAAAKPDAARDVLLGVVEQLRERPFTQAELDRAKTLFRKQFELTLAQTDQLAISLSESMAQGDWRLFFRKRDLVEAASLADVQRAAERYLKTSNRSLATYLPTEKPDRAEIPAALDVAAVVKDYQGQAAVAQGEAFDASPENIDRRTIRFTAPGGLKGALLAKRTKGNLVSANLTLRFGSEASLQNKGAGPDVVGGMLLRGTATRTREQLKDELDRLRAQITVSGTAEQAQVSITTVRENLGAVLALVAEVLRQPAFPQKEFELLVAEELAGQERARFEPDVLASTALEKHLSPYPAGHARAVDSPDESIAQLKKVTLDDVRSFHRSFYGADHATFAAVGDFDAPELQATILRLFGDWKSATPYARIPDRLKKASPLEEALETPDKANAYLAAGSTFALQDTDADYPAFLMANWLFGGGALKSRLADRIRQKEGLSYGVGASFSASSREPVAEWQAYAIYAPQNAAKLESALRDEIQKARSEGFRAEELEEGRQAWLQNREVSRTRDAPLVAKLSGYLDLDRTMAFDAELDRKVRALTGEQLNAAFRKYLDPAQLSVVKAGDFAAKKPGS
jgi:zinc protease